MTAQSNSYDPLATVRDQLLQSLRELQGAVERMQTAEDLQMIFDILRLIPETSNVGSYSPSLVDASQHLRSARERLARVTRNSGQHGAVK
jgi:hypothetical protein